MNYQTAIAFVQQFTHLCPLEVEQASFLLFLPPLEALVLHLICTFCFLSFHQNFITSTDLQPSTRQVIRNSPEQNTHRLLEVNQKGTLSHVAQQRFVIFFPILEDVYVNMHFYFFLRSRSRYLKEKKVLTLTDS